MPRAPVGARILATGLAIALITPLGGCQLRRIRPVLRPLEGTLYMAVGVSQEALDAELQKEVREKTTQLQDSFRALQPRIRLQVQVFPEQNLPQELRVRNATGLSPDLLLVNEGTARDLARERLIEPVSFPPAVLEQLDAGSVERVRRTGGTLTGLPLELQPQVACFNRRRLQSSPGTLADLLAVSAKGAEVGLPIDNENLAWTLGPLGALEPVSGLLERKPLTAADRQRLRDWLRWLRQADLQQHVTVYPNETEVLKELMEGSIDWTPCRTINLTRLRSRMGRSLGVAPLPSGPFGSASPITRERVLAFGVDSSPAQRQMALALARFAISPLNQRDMVLRNEYVLPVSREVEPPVRSSSIVAAMVEAREQSLRQSTMRLSEGNTQARREEWQALLTRYLFDDLSLEATLDGLIGLLRGESP